MLRMDWIRARERRSVRENMQESTQELMVARAADGPGGQRWDCYCCGYRMRQCLVEEIQRVCNERPELSRLLTLSLAPPSPPPSPPCLLSFLGLLRLDPLFPAGSK